MPYENSDGYLVDPRVCPHGQVSARRRARSEDFVHDVLSVTVACELPIHWCMLMSFIDVEPWEASVLEKAQE